MFGLDLAYPFGLGVVAAFNPCGFAMLPVFVAFFMGSNKAEDIGITRQVVRALKVSLVLTLGFILVFGVFGIITAFAAGAIKSRLPYVVMVLGVLFVPLGIAMMRGFEPKINIPRLQKGGDSDELASMFLFGVSYAVVSLGCTLGPFIATSSGALTQDNFFESVSVFLAYGIGMGAVITALTLGVALAQDSIATNMRKVLPWVNRVSGLFLALSGLYLVLYGYWEYRILILRDEFDNPIVDFFSGIQNNIVGWINETGDTRLGVGLLVLISAAVLRALWPQLSERARLGGLAAVGGLWAVAEAWWQRGDLFILPIARTIASIPERFGNWFSDPIRWGTLGELLVVAFVAWRLWRRFGPDNARLETKHPTWSQPESLR